MQKINTSALPDIIFMLLFFFMVTTTMREITLIVKVVPPEATEVQKLEKKSLVSYIYVGVPIKTQFGTESRIQLNDQFANTSDITEFIASERNSRDEQDRKFLTYKRGSVSQWCFPFFCAHKNAFPASSPIRPQGLQQ